MPAACGGFSRGSSTSGLGASSVYLVARCILDVALLGVLPVLYVFEKGASSERKRSF
jgi:hypothetical protein